LIYADRMPSGHENDRYSEGYYGTAPSLFDGAMSLWMSGLEPAAQGTAGPGNQGAGERLQDYTLKDYTFVDLGCGKGRVVMMASLYPFLAVRGIDLSEAMIGVARMNLRRWRRAQTRNGRAVCGDVGVVQGDVLGPEVDGILGMGGAVILFLFNSFGAEVLAGLMEKLARAARGGMTVDLIYVHPDHDATVAATPGAKLLFRREILFSEEDARADFFEAASDVCSIYRIGG
jgi:SAM-dependent methyltransferase